MKTIHTGIPNTIRNELQLKEQQKYASECRIKGCRQRYIFLACSYQLMSARAARTGRQSSQAHFACNRDRLRARKFALDVAGRSVPDVMLACRGCHSASIAGEPPCTEEARPQSRASETGVCRGRVNAPSARQPVEWATETASMVLG